MVAMGTGRAPWVAHLAMGCAHGVEVTYGLMVIAIQRQGP